MVASIFSLFGLKIDVSVTSPHYLGQDSWPQVEEQDLGEGQPRSPCHPPRGLVGGGARADHLARTELGPGPLKPPVTSWAAGVLLCAPSSLLLPVRQRSGIWSQETVLGRFRSVLASPHWNLGSP